MKNNYVLTLLMVTIFNALYSMEKEPPKLEYVEDARSLSQEHELYFSVLPKDILGIIQYYRLAEIIKLKISQAQDSNQALEYVKKLASGEYTQLFNNPRFIDNLIQKISSRFVKNPEEIARDINTLGASLWLTQLRPDQIKFLEAAQAGDLSLVQQLIAAGVNVNAQDTKGNTALMIAAHYGHIEVVKMLIKVGANINARSHAGWTALIEAALGGYAEVVKVLIKAGANVNAKTTTGYTALINAAERGHAEIVEELIAADADVTAQNKFGETALDYARMLNYKEVIELLENATNK